ncbi:carboxypeptidase regulatory-like domain-containing protein [Pedobacter sp. MC2016-15]|uniref:TonB-dependent receptor n=1 Tax=Pedobacter sp. MC2016-15 TaxID=2994473 RepID=UPI0022485ACF|nr:carboxypeptidase regulatory-like domain-containing protein [Pedobacter sp. MC2016-15]MCX2481397.1 carboxypeptidase regulatory-like domain-containing protein [Pedobacter sp. MC2016-15]
MILIQPAHAQSTDASVTGKVTDEKGAAVPGASVVLRNESNGFRAVTTTNKDGLYNLIQLPLGRPYTITVTFIGFPKQVKGDLSLNQGDNIVANFRLTEGNTELKEVNISANGLTKRIDRFGASTAITAQNIQQLPTQNRNFNNLSALAPTTNGTNISGQRASSTNYLIDGASARNNLTSGAIGSGPYSLSLEAIREFEVATNVYDTYRGREGGGTVSAVTKSGTNTLTGSVFDYYRSDFLASPNDIRGNKREQKFTTNQYGFSLGGAIIKDKLHFFTALDRQDESMPFQIADIRDDADAISLGISKGALDSVVNIGRAKYGLGSGPQVGEFKRKTLANTFFARIDWQINDKNRLTIRNNYSDWNNPVSNSDNSNINLFEVWGDFKSKENSTLVSLRSQIKPNFLNELKVQWQTATRDYVPNSELPAANIPRAIVTVRSTLPNGTVGNRTVQLGGQRYFPENNKENQLQLVNTSYYTSGKYKFTFGTDNTLTYMDTYISSEQNGRFIFNSLSEFDNLNASRYVREAPLAGKPAVQQYILNASLFGQVEFDVATNINAMFGLRYDVTSFLSQADYNPVVDRTLGLRTDSKITDAGKIQPRVQFTWDLNGEKKDIIRLGAGLFSSYPVNYAQVNNIQNSGTMVGSIDVSRPATGTSLVPVPNFPAYRADPGTAPGIIAGVPYVSTINLNDPNLKMPSIFKTNLSYNKIIGDQLRLGVNFLYSYTKNNYVYLDRNLVDNPYFTLANEENRSVFVPASSITASGTTNNVLGRKTNEVGRVLMLTNGATLRQAAVIVDASYRYLGDGYLNVSYTLNDAKDNSSYNGNVANTSTFRPVKSDPRDLSAVDYSDNQYRNKLVVYGSTPSWKGFSASATFRGIGGTRYSMTVDADINGDFVGGPGNDNDLASVFDPNSPTISAANKASMEKILNNPDNRSKKYILESLGKIARRNGGVNPFSGTFDIRVQKEFKTYKTQRLTLSFDAFNFANLLNKKWGVNYNLGDQSLLFVTRFDQARQQYEYRINENVGVTQPNGTPYQIQLGARYSF